MSTVCDPIMRPGGVAWQDHSEPDLWSIVACLEAPRLTRSPQVLINLPRRIKWPRRDLTKGFLRVLRLF